MPEGRKDDGGKVRMELLSSIALRKVAEVLTFGAKKYADENWRAGIAWKRVIGAALRHLTAWKDGEDADPETNLSHAAHAACCLMFLLEYLETHPELDDRYKVGEKNEKPNSDVQPSRGGGTGDVRGDCVWSGSIHVYPFRTADPPNYSC